MRVLSSLLAVFVAQLVFVDSAFAQTDAPFLTADGLAGIAIAMAAIGGAMGQARAISAALESISRNPGAAGQLFLPWLLALVLIESLVIYAFVIALRLVGMI